MPGLLGLRYQKMPVARAGVEGRKHLLRCLELDPKMADANLGLGIYNYYVDTLSAMAKVLRFFMGIPGGDKRVGLRQLETAATKGELTQAEARFNMAKKFAQLRFRLCPRRAGRRAAHCGVSGKCYVLAACGDIEQKLGHKDEAAARFRAAAAATSEDAACTARAQQLAREALATLGVQ